MDKKSSLKTLQLYARLGLAPLYLSAGMPRSGSTLLFNVLRLCLERKYQTDLSFGWIDDIRSLPPGKAYLLKTHSVSPILRMRSSAVFYTFRDVRDAMVSAKRKFNIEPSIDQCRTYIHEQQEMNQAANVQFQYEHFVDDLPGTITRVADSLGLHIPTQEIMDRLPKADGVAPNAQGYDKETLLHANHATNTRSGDWRSQLGDDLKREIRWEFADWLSMYGYPLD